HPAPSHIPTPALHDALPISLYASARAAELQGITEGSYHGPFQEFFSCILREDRSRMRQAYRELVEGQRRDYQVTYQARLQDGTVDRKSTRLNSSHVKISYAV